MADVPSPGIVRGWWAENWAAAATFALLLMIVFGEISDFLDDRTRADRETRLTCIIDNVSASAAESVQRLRRQQPTVDAARDYLAAITDEERERAVALMRANPPPPPGTISEFHPEDCGDE